VSQPRGDGGDDDGSAPLVVYVPFPMLHDVVDADRLAVIHPGIEVLTTPFEVEHDFRTAREQDPLSVELREQAPALTGEQRDAFARAEIVFTLDVPMDLPSLAPSLRWVQCIGSGVGQYVSARLPEGNIVLTNGAGIASAPIAEWVLARTLQIVKRLPQHDAAARERHWELALGGNLAGSTVAIVGLGAIGREVARRFRGFGVHLLGVRRTWTCGATDPDVDELFGPDAIAEVVGRADVTVLAAPGSDENESLFDAGMLAAMKPGSIFVNVARGTLVDEPALIDALERGHLGAAAIDVARAEPLPPDDPLWAAPNLLISPHSSASVERYAERAFDLFCDNLERYVAGKPLRNVVDLTSGY
jgi:phosphoglycerate dehydrogenase-like enzyme